MDIGWGVVMPVMKQQKIKYAATQHKQSSHRGAGGLWGLFSANIFVSDSSFIRGKQSYMTSDLGQLLIGLGRAVVIKVSV